MEIKLNGIIFSGGSETTLRYLVNDTSGIQNSSYCIYVGNC